MKLRSAMQNLGGLGDAGATGPEVGAGASR